MEEKKKHTKLKKIVKYASFVMLAGFAATIYIIYNPPAFLIELVRKQAEVQVLKATDLYTKVDKISKLRLGLFKQTVVAEGITILKNNTTTAPTFLTSQNLDINFNVLSFLFLGPEKSTLELKIINPTVDINRNKKGEIDIDTPLLKPKEKKEEAKSVLPRILFTLENGMFNYTDATFANKLIVNARIPSVKAEVQNSEFLKYSAQIYNQKDLIDVNGTLNTNTGQGKVSSKINIEDLSKWVNVFYDVTKGSIVLRRGTLDIDLNASWDNLKFANLKFDSTIKSKDLIGKFPYYNSAVNIENLNLSLDQNRVDLKDLTMNTLGSTIKARVDSIYNGDKTYIKSNLRANNLDIDKIIASVDKKFIPDSVKNLDLKGNGDIDLNVEGFYPKINKKLAFFSYPETFEPKEVNGKIDIKQAGAYGTNIDRISTKIFADNNNAKLQDFYMQAYDGKVTGDVTVNKIFQNQIGKLDNKNAFYSGNLVINKINLGKILTDLKDPVPLAYKPYGSINGNVKVAGKLADPQVKAKVYTPQLRFDPKYSQLSNINDLYVDASYSKNLIDAKTKLVSYDFGKTAVDFTMKNQDIIAVKADTDNLKLNSLNQFIPNSINANINSGNLDAKVVADFSLKAIKDKRNLTPERLTKIVNAKGNLDFSGLNLIYKTAKSPFTLTNTSGNFYLDMGQGDIASRLNLNSNETGVVNANLNLNDMDALNAKVSTVNLPLKKLEPFVPNLYVKSGNIALKSNVVTSLKTLMNKNLSLDQMIAYLNTDTTLGIKNVNLLYKTPQRPYSLSNANGDFYLNSNGRDLNSDLQLVSSEYGNASAEIFVNDLNALNARINVKDISTKTVASFVPKLNANKGLVSVSANVNTSLNQIRFSKLPITSLIETKARINLDNSDFAYTLAKNKFVRSTNTNADMYLSLKNGNVASELTFNSDQFGQGNLVASLKNFNDTYARLNVNNIPSKTLETFVPNLKVKSGNGDIKLTVNTKLNELSKDPSLDRLTYIVSANTDISFRNNSLTYSQGKSKVNIDNGLANIRFDMQKGIVKSTYLMSSNQFGKLVGFLDVDKNRNVVGTFSNDTLDLRNVSQFIPNGKIERGTGRFNLAVAGNIRKFTEDPSAIAVKGGFNVDDLIASYNSGAKVYPVEFSAFRNTFNYAGGIFKTDLNVLSNDIGSLTAYANVDLNSGKLNGKAYSRNIKLASIDKFVKTDNLDINDGNLALNVNLNGNLSSILENPLYFNADGDIKVNNFRTVYIDNKTTEKIKKEDGTTSEEPKRINQEIDNMLVDFDWKQGTLNLSKIQLKENASELNGKGSLDIENYLAKKPNNSNINLVSKNFNFKDFPITELGNIKGGSIQNLELNTNLPTGLSDLKMSLNTTVKNLNVDDKATLDTILAQVNINKSIVNLNHLTLFQAENYMKAKGIVNISNMNNPRFDVNLNSRKFPLKAIFALIPEAVLNRTASSEAISNSDLNKVKLTYKLPVKNSYAVKNKEINVNDLLNYWEKWSLEPLTEEDAKNQSKAPVWKAIDGEISVNLDAKGDALEPIANIDMLLSNGFIYDRKINEIFFKASYKDGDINVPNFHFVEEEGGYITASGKMLQSGKIEAEADGKLNLNWAKTFMTDKSVDVEGDTILTLDVRGTSTNPDVAISVDAERGGVFNNVYFDDLVFIAGYKDQIARLTDVRLVAGGKEAKASGVIPLDSSLGSMNVSLGLSGESLGLVNLFTREVEWLKGSGDAFVNLQGSISDPIINGNLNIQDAQIYVAALGKPLEKVNVNIAMSNHYVKINRADTFLNDGKVSMLGQVDLIGFRPGFLKLKLFADDFRWEQDNINVAGKVSLNINNTISEPLVGGQVQITKGEMTFGLGGSGSSKAGKTATPKKKTKAAIDAQFNNLKVEIPKETDFWVRSPFFDLRPFGDLNLKEGSVYSPTILGFAGIDKGNLYIINNEFNIIEATADFGGKDFERDVFPINPKLTIIADTKLLNPRNRQNVDVEAKITGTLEDIPDNNIKIDWTKTGGMTDAEIWTQVIGLNAAQELVQDTGSGNATTIAKFATPYFNRALFNPLTSKVADFLALDEFNVGIASDAITNPGVSVSIAKPIYAGLSIGYQGVIRTSNLAQYNYFARYRFNNGLSLRTSIDERNAAGIQGEYGFGF